MPLPTGSTALYRLYDAEGVLLYIGISNDPLHRWLDHSRNKKWWPLASRFDITWHSRLAAEKAELQAIKAEKPVHNLVGTDHYRNWRSLRPGGIPTRTVDPIRSRKASVANHARRLRIRAFVRLLDEGLSHDEARAESDRLAQAYKDESGAFSQQHNGRGL